MHILLLAHGHPGNLVNFEDRVQALQKGARLAEVRLYDLRVDEDELDAWLTRLGNAPGHVSHGNPLRRLKRLLTPVAAVLGFKPMRTETKRLGPREGVNPYVYTAIIGVRRDPFAGGIEIV